MKLLVFIVPFEYGGGENVISNLLSELQERSVEVDVISVTYSKNLEDVLSEKRIRFLFLTKTKLGYGFNFFSAYGFITLLLLGIKVLVKKHKIKEYGNKADIIWVHGFPANIFSFIIFGYDTLKKKGIYTHHSKKRSGRISVVKKLYCQILGSFKYITCISDIVADSVKNFCPNISKNVITILNGINMEPFRVSFENADLIRNDLRKRLGISDSDLVIVYVARFSDSKNHVFFLKLADNLRDKNLKIILVGDGPLFNFIRNKVSSMGLVDKFILTGFVKNEEIYRYYLASDISVFPSLTEGFGLGMLEALAAGLEVFALENVVPKSLKKFVNTAQNEEELLSNVTRVVRYQNFVHNFELRKTKALEIWSLYDIKKCADEYCQLFADF